MPEPREMTAEELEKVLAGVTCAGIDADDDSHGSRLRAHIAALTVRAERADDRIQAFEMALRLKSEEAEHFTSEWHKAVSAVSSARADALEEAARLADAAKKERRDALARMDTSIPMGRAMYGRTEEAMDACAVLGEEIRALKSRPAERMAPVSMVRDEARKALAAAPGSDGHSVGWRYGVRALADALGGNVDE